MSLARGHLHTSPGSSLRPKRCNWPKPASIQSCGGRYSLNFAISRCFYGNLDSAADLLAELRTLSESTPWARAQIDAARAQFSIRNGELATARSVLDGIRVDEPCSSTAHKARILATRAYLLVTGGFQGSAQALQVALEQARSQSAGFWAEFTSALAALHGRPADLRRFIRSAGHDSMAAMSIAAELVAPRLQELESEELAKIEFEARLRPSRWRDALRVVVDADSSNVAAARLLERIGALQDVARLRGVARFHRGRPESATWTSSCAPGRISRCRRGSGPGHDHDVDSRAIEGSSIRRKVLALLCFLLSRPSTLGGTR